MSDCDWQTSLQSLLREDLGLRWTQSHATAIDAFVRARSRQLDLRSEDDYLRLVVRDERERRRLWSKATIGETFFFREVAALRHAIEWAGEVHRATGRAASIWSAGCATGEEAYSLAILAADVGVPVEILATDVDTSALEAAGRARYDAWSLRKLPLDVLGRYFQPEAKARSESSGIFRAFRKLRDPIRSSVTFRAHNLLSVRPEAPERPGGWDLVLCRNVLYYLEPDRADEVFERLLSSLGPTGRLLLGSAEALKTPADAVVEHRESTVAYRRLLPSTGPHVDPPTDPPVGEASSSSATNAPRAIAASSPGRSGVDGVARAWQRSEPPGTEVRRRRAILSVRAALSAGDVQSARRTLDELDPAVAHHAGLQLLRAITARGQGDDAVFEKSLRLVLDIDPGRWTASFLLAIHLDRRGDRLAARSLFQRTLRSLENDPSEFDAMASPVGDSVLPSRGIAESICRSRLSDPGSVRRPEAPAPKPQPRSPSPEAPAPKPQSESRTR